MRHCFIHFRKYADPILQKVCNFFIRTLTTVFEIIKRHPVICLTFLMLCTNAFIFKAFLQEKVAFIYSDSGSDTQQVYYPFFVNLANMLEQGNFSFWDFNYGVGCNILTRQADIGSIFTWLICGFGAQNVRFMLVVVHILKVLLSGYMCYAFLKQFHFSSFATVAVSYLFAFNGFTMLWGQHYFFGACSLLIIFMFWAIEKAFRSIEGYLWTAFATFTVMCTSYYLAYMILLTAGVYALFRLLFMHSLKKPLLILKKIGGLLLAVIIGSLMGAFLFIPSVGILVNNSSRLDNGLSFLAGILRQLKSSFDGKTKWAVLSRLYSNNLMGAKDFDGPLGYYGLPTWFFSSLTVFIGTAFGVDLLVRKDWSFKKKFLILLGCGATVYMGLYPFVAYAMNGFVAVTFRFMYVIMPAFALMYALALDRIFCGKLSGGKLLITAAGIFSMLLLVLIISKTATSSETGKQLGYLYLLIIAAFAMICLCAQNTSLAGIKRTFYVFLAFAVLCANVGIENYVTNNDRKTLSAANSAIMAPVVGGEKTINALDYIRDNDNSFYRVEKLSTTISGFNDAMVQDYYGISTYNSVVNQNMIDFCSVFCPEFKSRWNGYYTFRNIYQNTDIVSLLGVKYVLSGSPIEDVKQYTLYARVGGMYIYRNEESDGIAKFYTNAISYDSYMAMAEEDRAGLISNTLILQELPNNTVSNQTEAQATVSFGYPDREDHFKGVVDAGQDGWLFVAIPYENGWHAYVDGQEVDIYQADIAYSAIKLAAGKHQISFEYNTPLFKEGIIVSCIGVAFFVLWFAVIYVQKKKGKRI